MVQVVKFTPSVIEPSFGVGRILHALLEHSFSVRKEDAQRVVFQFAPVAVSYTHLTLPTIYSV